MLHLTRRALMGAACALPLMAYAASAEGLITIIVNDPANPFWFTEGEVAQETAEKLGYTTSLVAHKGDTNTETTLVDTAITNQSAAIILDPANADGSIGAVKKAVAAGIPVFVINAEINESGLAKAQLVANNAQGAALGAQHWAEALDGEGPYVELFGNPSDNNAQTRSNGYETVLSQYPDLEKVGQEVAQWDRTQAYQKTQSLLQVNADIKGLIAGNDEMALGAVAALKEAGKLGQVKVAGFDGTPEAVAAVKAGELEATILQPVAVFARAAVEQADSFLKTGATGVAEEKQLFDCLLITKENADKVTKPFVLSE